jgi:hypothetical protein
MQRVIMTSDLSSQPIDLTFFPNVGDSVSHLLKRPPPAVNEVLLIRPECSPTAAESFLKIMILEWELFVILFGKLAELFQAVVKVVKFFDQSLDLAL